MIEVGKSVRVKDEGSTLHGWTGKVSGPFSDYAVYVRFTSEFGYTERLLFLKQLEEVADPAPPNMLKPDEPCANDVCHCGNYVLRADLGPNVVFTIEACTGLPNGPMEAHTRRGCYSEVTAHADLPGVTRFWIEDQSRMFPLAHKHPLFAMGTHSCCTECGEVVDLSEPTAYTGGQVRCDEHARVWKAEERECRREAERDARAERDALEGR